MDAKESNKKMSTFLIKKTSIDLLDEICKEVNTKVNIRVTKSQIVDMLIQDAKRRDVSKLILTY
jgi:hypothetical protein